MNYNNSVDFKTFAAMYCETQDNTPDGLRTTLLDQVQRFKPDGWLIAEAQLFDSSSFGSRVILPFGPNNTLKQILDHPFSPRGLASDQSIVIAWMAADALTQE